MRFTFTAKSLLVGCAVGLAACATPTNTTTNMTNTTNTANITASTTAPATAPTAAAPSSVPFPDIRRITPNELQALLAKNEAVVVDVRGIGAYETGHVQGALHIPADETTARLKELPRDKTIVTYCS